MPGVASRTAVQRAVDEFDVRTFQLKTEPAALEAARESLDQSGLLLLGEVHGVRQNALAIRALMADLDVTGLALEWPAELATAVSQFMADGKVPDHPLLWGGDGRITAGHFAVLRERFNAGQLTALTLFDGVNEVGWSRREAAMADRILDAVQESGARRTLVVAGNAHTALSATGLGVPLGARLAERRPGVREVRIWYGNGSYYNLTPQRFKRQWTLRHDPRLRVEGEALILDLPSPIQARVPHRTQTGSQPVLRTGGQPVLVTGAQQALRTGGQPVLPESPGWPVQRTPPLTVVQGEPAPRRQGSRRPSKAERTAR